MLVQADPQSPTLERPPLNPNRRWGAAGWFLSPPMAALPAAWLAQPRGRARRPPERALRLLAQGARRERPWPTLVARMREGGPTHVRQVGSPPSRSSGRAATAPLVLDNARGTTCAYVLVLGSMEDAPKAPCVASQLAKPVALQQRALVVEWAAIRAREEGAIRVAGRTILRFFGRVQGRGPLDVRNRVTSRRPRRFRLDRPLLSDRGHRGSVSAPDQGPPGEDGRALDAGDGGGDPEAASAAQ